MSPSPATLARRLAVAGILLGFASFGCSSALSAPEAKTTDSGKGEKSVVHGSRYTTTVERRTEGSLTQEDFRQASLLASRILGHLHRSAEHLADGNEDAAKAEVEKARSLAGIIRDMLPVTVVTTVVRNADGKQVYSSTERIQDDRIPIFQGMIEVEVVEPVVEAKKELASVKGLELADAELIHTSALLDLGYVERKLRACDRAIGSDRDEAIAQLALARTAGVHLVFDETDSPLVKAQSALRIAERMVRQGKFDAARKNLQIARTQIEIYRGLAGESADQRVHDLDKEIAEVMVAIEKPEAVKKIREFWDRLTGWFKTQPGAARATSTGRSGSQQP